MADDADRQMAALEQEEEVLLVQRAQLRERAQELNQQLKQNGNPRLRSLSCANQPINLTSLQSQLQVELTNRIAPSHLLP